MIVRKHARFRFFLDAFRAVCAAILGLSVVLWLLLSTQALLDAPVLPALSSLVQLSMGLIPAVLALALPLGLLFGCTAAAWNWRTDGELLALNASGLGGRTLLPSALFLGLLFGAAEASLTHYFEPMGRRAVTKALVRSTHALEIQPRHPSLIGDVLVHADEVIDGRARELTLARGQQVTIARMGEFTTTGSLRLFEGEVVSLADDGDGNPAWRLRFEEASIPLEPPALRLDPPTLRGDELLERIRRMEAEGRPPWVERTTWYKRFTLPLTLPFLAWLGLCLGGRGLRPALTASFTGLGWWAAMRICDHSVTTLGALPSVLLPLLLLVLLSWVSWRGWAEK